MHSASSDCRVGAGQVDVLEDTPRTLLFGEPLAAQPVLVDGDQLARFNLAHEAGTDDVERRRLGGDDPSAFEAAEYQRADALRVACRIQRGLVHEDQAVCAAQAGKHFDGGRFEGVVEVAGEQRGDNCCVCRVAAGELAVGLRVALVNELQELSGVGQVAVVAERDGTAGGATQRGLRVLPAGRPGRGVASVADGDVAGERVQRVLVEDLRHEPHVFVDEDLLAVAGRDAGRLLAAVLQRVEAEVAEFGDFFAGCPDPEYAARVLRAFLAWQ